MAGEHVVHPGDRVMKSADETDGGAGFFVRQDHRRPEQRGQAQDNSMARAADHRAPGHCRRFGARAVPARGVAKIH